MSVSEILAQAISSDANAFRTALIQQANDHADMFDTTRNQRAKDSAQAQLNACLFAYDQIGRIDHPLFGEMTASDAATLIANDRNASIVAFNVACKLLDISPAVRTAKIVEHFDAAGWSN